MIFASFAKKHCIVINGQNKLTSDSLSSRTALFYLKHRIAITPLHDFAFCEMSFEQLGCFFL